MRRTAGPVTGIAVGITVSIGLLAAPATAASPITARPVVRGADTPTAFTFGPGNVIWYVEKSNGEIHAFDVDTGRDTTLATIPGVNADGERGMLGIALDPGYPSQPFVYVYATRTDGGHLRNEILRVRDANGSGTDRTAIWSAPASSSPYHNGGRIAFGADGMLYAAVGDGHDAANAQDRTSNDRGKILRMTPDGGVPNDNPFARSRIYAYGIRNSFGFAFDPRGGSLWETENGPECNDELNRILPGRNYGWGPHETCSGSSPRNTNQDGPNPVLPRLWYTPTIAPTGVAFCRRCGLGPRSRGRLFFGAFNTGQIRRVTLNAARTDVRAQKVVFTNGSGITSIEESPAGRLYFSDGSGIYRLVRS
ncbi:MAG: PQQ-dependent sugar dehydrogenase [Actinomycetota bacterium]